MLINCASSEIFCKDKFSITHPRKILNNAQNQLPKIFDIQN